MIAPRSRKTTSLNRQRFTATFYGRYSRRRAQRYHRLGQAFVDVRCVLDLATWADLLRLVPLEHGDFDPVLVIRSRLEGFDGSGGFRLVGQVSGLTLRKAREKM